MVLACLNSFKGLSLRRKELKNLNMDHKTVLDLAPPYLFGLIQYHSSSSYIFQFLGLTIQHLRIAMHSASFSLETSSMSHTSTTHLNN